MTFYELIKQMSTEFNMLPMPVTYEVDAETYANVCQHHFTNSNKTVDFINQKYPYYEVKLLLGPNKGVIIFQYTELILKREEKT